MRDLILKSLFFETNWPDLFPFVVSKGATILLENVIIEIDTRAPSLDFLDAWVQDIKGKHRPADLMAEIEPAEEQHLSHWEPDDCLRFKLKSQDCMDLGLCVEVDTTTCQENHCGAF